MQDVCFDQETIRKKNRANITFFQKHGYAPVCSYRFNNKCDIGSGL